MSSRPQFKVRPFRTSDIDQAILIAEEVNLSPWSRNGFVEHLSDKSTLSIALEENQKKLVGFLLARLVPGQEKFPDAELLNIGICSAYQGNGGGKLLIESFLLWCSEHGVDQLWLEVRLSNKAAQNFYGCFGFVRAGRRKNFYTGPTEDALIMRRELKS